MPGYKYYLGLDQKDFLKLNKKELNKAVGTLRDVVAKRYKRLESIGGSQASAALKRGGGLISTKNKNLNQLRSEFMRAKSFLEKKTSTVKGYRESVKRAKVALAERGINIENEEFRNVWSIYEKVKDAVPMVADLQFKYKILEYVQKSMGDNISTEEIVEKAINNFEQLYEETVEKDDYDFWTSIF